MKRTLIFIFCFCLIQIINASIITVSPYGSADYVYMQSAINVAADGDTVLAGPGHYYENIDFLGKKITVASHYLISEDPTHIEATVIDGGNNDSVVKMISGEDTLSYLCGFVIRNGNYNRGGGIRIYHGGAKLEHLRIRNNLSESPNYPWGGGLSADGAHEMPEYHQLILRDVEITDNTVSGNCASCGGFKVADRYNLVIFENVTVSGNEVEIGANGGEGGGYFYKCNNIHMRNCVIENNSVESNSDAGHGGLFFYYVEDVLIEDCQFLNNSVEGLYSSTGGLSIHADGAVTVRNCLIAGNTVYGFWIASCAGMTLSSLTCANYLVEDCEICDNQAIMTGQETSKIGGLGLSYESNAILNRVLIHDNSADIGSGLQCYATDFLLINSIIYNNQLHVFGGETYYGFGRYSIANSILWTNENILLNETTDIQLYHNIIQGGESGITCTNGGDYFWGEGNSALDPMFINAPAANFQLQAGSPGIDAGVNACPKWGREPYIMPEQEIIGKNRDIGIFETGDDDFHFDIPPYLSNLSGETISLDLEEYMEGMTGDLSVSFENNIISAITGNTINWEAVNNWSGFDEVRIDFQTDSGQYYSDNILIGMLEFNHPPVIELPDSVSFNNISEYSFDLMQCIYDIEEDIFDVCVEGSEHLNVMLQDDYLYIYAEPGWHGVEYITVIAEEVWNRQITTDSLEVCVFCRPIADCGDYLYKRDGESVILDGSASIDPLLNGLNYSWSTSDSLNIINADSVFATVNLPEIEEREQAWFSLEVDDNYNSSSDSLRLMYWDDEPRNVECDVSSATETIRISWNRPYAVNSDYIYFAGYQMFFEGSAFDSLQDPGLSEYTFYLPPNDYDFGLQAIYGDGESEIIEISSVDAHETEILPEPGFHNIYPNPFNIETTISFYIPEQQEYSELIIYNVKGQRIREFKIHDAKLKIQEIVWDGKDFSGNIVTSGVYFCKLKTDNMESAKRLILLK